MKKKMISFMPVTGRLKVVSFLLFVLTVSGCSLFSSEDSGPRVSPLPSITSSVDISEAWSQSTGNGQGGIWLTLHPAISGHVIYTASHAGVISAFDINNGKMLWSHGLDMPVTGGVGVGDGLVAVGVASGRVVVLDAVNGQKKWSAAASGEILAAPVIGEDVVSVQSIDGKVTTFNRQTGDRLWQQGVATPLLLLRGSSSPVVYQRRLYTGFANGDVIAWNAETGQSLWQTTIALPEGDSELARMVDVDATPMIRAGKLYAISYQGSLKALDLSGGQVLWTRKASSYQGMVASHDDLYVSTAKSYLSAIEQSSGATLWTQKALAYRQLSAPQVYKDFVIAGDDEGYLHVLSRNNGSFSGRYRVSSSGIRAQPLIFGDRILVFANDGKLVALKIRKK